MQGARKLEDGKEQQPERFAVPVTADQTRLPVTGDIGIGFIVALVRVMFQMTDAEADRSRKDIRQVAENCDNVVCQTAVKNEPVCGVVDDDIETMIGESADAVGHDQGTPPIGQTESAHAGRKRNLYRYDKQGHERGPGIAADKIAGFRMSLQ